LERYADPLRGFTDRTRAEIGRSHKLLHELSRHGSRDVENFFWQVLVSLKDRLEEQSSVSFEPAGVRLSILDLIKRGRWAIKKEQEEVGPRPYFLELPSWGGAHIPVEIFNGILDFALKEAKRDGSPQLAMRALRRFDNAILDARGASDSEGEYLAISFNSRLGYLDDWPLEEQANYWYHLAIGKRRPIEKEHAELSREELLNKALEIDPWHELARQLLSSEKQSSDD
jgi:hypothetical protein